MLAYRAYMYRRERATHEYFDKIPLEAIVEAPRAKGSNLPFHPGCVKGWVPAWTAAERTPLR